MAKSREAEESLINYRKELKWVGKIFMQDENNCYKDGYLAGLKAERAERIKEIIKEYPDFGKGVGYKMCMVDELEKESCK